MAPPDQSDTPPTGPSGLPHDIDHTHSDVSGGWLRAASFGAVAIAATYLVGTLVGATVT